jgi:hypothetical protein
MDRRNPQKVARYFENFLDAVRVFEDAELTEKLVQVTREVIRSNPDLVSDEAYSRLTQRTYDAVSAGGVVQADEPGSFLETVLGKTLAPDDPLLPKFVSGLRRARIEGTPIALDPARVSPPTTTRLVTRNNIQVIVPMDVWEFVEEQPDRIIIHDSVARRYDDTDRNR